MNLPSSFEIIWPMEDEDRVEEERRWTVSVSKSKPISTKFTLPDLPTKQQTMISVSWSLESCQLSFQLIRKMEWDQVHCWWPNKEINQSINLSIPQGHISLLQILLSINQPDEIDELLLSPLPTASPPLWGVYRGSWWCVFGTPPTPDRPFSTNQFQTKFTQTFKPDDWHNTHP